MEASARKKTVFENLLRRNAGRIIWQQLDMYWKIETKDRKGWGRIVEEATGPLRALVPLIMAMIMTRPKYIFPPSRLEFG
jgi:hypothetical protein